MKKKLCRILSVFIVLLLCLNAPATVFAEVDFLTAEEMVTLLEKEYPEDISRRTIQTKHFQIDEAGFIAATYTDPVHYLDNENQWQDIDNTLTLVSSAERATTASTLKSVATQYYENKANSFKVRFPEELGGSANI